MEEEKPDQPAKEAHAMLPCGHEDCFEHRFIQGMLQIVQLCIQSGQDPTTTMMAYITHVFTEFCIPIPTMEQVRALSINQNVSKEVR